jgi:hypothetical protein
LWRPPIFNIQYTIKKEINCSILNRTPENLKFSSFVIFYDNLSTFTITFFLKPKNIKHQISASKFFDNFKNITFDIITKLIIDIVTFIQKIFLYV